MGHWPHHGGTQLGGARAPHLWLPSTVLTLMPASDISPGIQDSPSKGSTKTDRQPWPPAEISFHAVVLFLQKLTIDAYMGPFTPPSDTFQASPWNSTPRRLSQAGLAYSGGMEVQGGSKKPQGAWHWSRGQTRFRCWVGCWRGSASGSQERPESSSKLGCRSMLHEYS